MHLLDFLWLDVFFLVFFLPPKKRFILAARYSKVNPPFNLTGVLMQGPGCGDANLSSLEWIDIKVCPGDNERQTPWTFPEMWHILPKRIHVGRYNVHINYLTTEFLINEPSQKSCLEDIKKSSLPASDYWHPRSNFPRGRLVLQDHCCIC